MQTDNADNWYIIHVYIFDIESEPPKKIWRWSYEMLVFIVLLGWFVVLCGRRSGLLNSLSQWEAWFGDMGPPWVVSWNIVHIGRQEAKILTP